MSHLVISIAVQDQIARHGRLPTAPAATSAQPRTSAGALGYSARPNVKMLQIIIIYDLFSKCVPHFALLGLGRTVPRTSVVNLRGRGGDVLQPASEQKLRKNISKVMRHVLKFRV